jgi:hypothetical protein
MEELMKKSLMGIAVCLMMGSSAFAGTPAEEKFEKLHGEKKAEQKITERIKVYESWNDDYELVKGTRSCKKNLEISYVSWDSGEVNHISIQADNGPQMYSDYIMNELSASDYLKFQQGESEFYSYMESFSGNNILNEDNWGKEKHTYNVRNFDENEIDMTVTWGNNNYDLNVLNVDEETILMRIKDRASMKQRWNGVKAIGHNRIRSRKCVYKKLHRTFDNNRANR